MKISAIHIHNFRGIHDESIDVFDYTLLVGPNNAGKSSVVDAIRAFYEKYTFKKDVDFPYISPADDESWIDMTFKLTTEEYLSLAEEYQLEDNGLCVRKYLKCKDSKKNGCIFGWTKGSTVKAADGTTKTTPRSLNDKQFYGEKNIQQGKLGDVIYIPAVSKVDDHTKLSGPSVLRDLLSNILEDVVEGSRSFQLLQDQFSSFATGIKEETTPDSRSLTSFETEFNELLNDWGIKFRLNVAPPTLADLVKQFFSYGCVDTSHGTTIKAEQCGSGFQRHFIYSLLQLGPRFVSRKNSKKSKDFTPDMTVLLFEEPEAFLHPTQQERLASSLRELSTTDSRQVIASTHSSHFVSRNMQFIPSLVRLKRTGGVVQSIQVRKRQWDEIVDSNQQLNALAAGHKALRDNLAAIDMQPEMEAVKYCLWMNPDRASAFFANNILLVEGPTEQALLSRLISEGALALPPGGIYVLDCMGKFNIHRFMNIFSKLGTPHAVLHDGDNDKGYHPDLHQLIQDSKDPKYTRHIECLPGDLEKVLKLKIEGRHGKPQHAMYMYEMKMIGENELAKLKEHVERCIAALT